VPDREVCTVRRSVTNTPLQALTLLNEPIFVEAARKVAERAYREGGSDTGARLEFLFRLATGRKARAPELSVLRKTFEQMLSQFTADQTGARALLAVGESTSDQAIPVNELAAYAAVANMVLNMDEVITKG
ncbi:MAG: DUF1553 domain-containing protein, partial [Bryobacteraceae bacterium]